MPPPALFLMPRDFIWFVVKDRTTAAAAAGIDCRTAIQDEADAIKARIEHRMGPASVARFNGGVILSIYNCSDLASTRVHKLKDS